jgi:tetratricopeptide (TPR) repeat protein
MISNETLDTMMSVGGGIANLLIILLIVCAVFFGIILIFMIIWALVSWYLAVRRGVAERKDAIDERVLQLEQENSEFTTTLQYFRDLNLKIDVLMERTNYFQETVTKLLVEGNQVRYVEMPKEEEPEIQVLSVDEDDDEVKGPAIQTVSLDEDKPSNISRSNDDIQLNALLSEGRSCIREYRYIEAIDLFTKIIEINPSLSQAYNFRGIARRKLGELDLAIEDYNLALNINENYVEVLNNRGVALDKKGDHDSAISDFTKAINIDASNPHTYNNRATAYTNKGDYNMTLVDCTRAIQEDNKMADAYVNRGVAKVLLGLNEDAETDFEIAVSFGYDRSIVDSKIADLKNKNV